MPWAQSHAPLETGFSLVWFLFHHGKEEKAALWTSQQLAPYSHPRGAEGWEVSSWIPTVSRTKEKLLHLYHTGFLFHSSARHMILFCRCVFWSSETQHHLSPSHRMTTGNWTPVSLTLKLALFPPHTPILRTARFYFGPLCYLCVWLLASFDSEKSIFLFLFIFHLLL